MLGIRRRAASVQPSGDDGQKFLLDDHPNAALMLSRYRRYSSFNGEAFVVYRQDNSNSMSFSYLPNGRIDWAAAAAFVAGTTGRIETWRSQSSGGTSNGQVGVTTSNGPLFYQSGALLLDPNGEQSLRWDATSANIMSWDDLNGSTMRPVSTFMRIWPTSWGSSGTSWRNFFLYSNGPRAVFRYRSSQPRLQQSYNSNNTANMFTGSPITITAISNDSNNSLYVDGVLEDTASRGNGTMSPFKSFGTGDGGNGVISIDECWVWLEDKTADRLSIEARLSETTA